MKLNARKMTREQERVFDLWTLLTLLAVVGAYLGTWIFLLPTIMAGGTVILMDKFDVNID